MEDVAKLDEEFERDLSEEFLVGERGGRVVLESGSREQGSYSTNISSL